MFFIKHILIKMIIMSFLYSTVSINLCPASSYKLSGFNTNDSLLIESYGLYLSFDEVDQTGHEKMISGSKLNQNDIVIGNIGSNNGLYYIQDKHSGEYYYSNQDILSLSNNNRTTISAGDKISIISLFNVIYFATKKESHFPLKYNSINIYDNYKVVELIITSEDINALYKELPKSQAYPSRYGVIHDSRATIVDFYNLLTTYLSEKKIIKNRDKRNKITSLNIKLEVIDNLEHIEKWYKGSKEGRTEEGLSIAYSIYKKKNLMYMIEEVIGEKYNSVDYLDAGDSDEIQLFRIFTIMINGLDNIIDKDRLNNFVYVVPKINEK